MIRTVDVIDGKSPIKVCITRADPNHRARPLTDKEDLYLRTMDLSVDQDKFIIRSVKLRDDRPAIKVCIARVNADNTIRSLTEEERHNARTLGYFLVKNDTSLQISLSPLSPTFDNGTYGFALKNDILVQTNPPPQTDNNTNNDNVNDDTVTTHPTESLTNKRPEVLGCTRGLELINACDKNCIRINSHQEFWKHALNVHFFFTGSEALVPGSNANEIIKHVGYRALYLVLSYHAAIGYEGIFSLNNDLKRSDKNLPSIIKDLIHTHSSYAPTEDLMSLRGIPIQMISLWMAYPKWISLFLPRIDNPLLFEYVYEKYPLVRSYLHLCAVFSGTRINYKYREIEISTPIGILSDLYGLKDNHDDAVITLENYIYSDLTKQQAKSDGNNHQ